ncbi:alpha/beta hydrolase [Alphaproteobacteria bacterium]|mgnify:CR=1 FL=1|nr:alpha/beta hydrolase [Alphaproteobacteria bacterium]
MTTIDINGTQINYIDEGPKDAPAIVFSNSMFFDVSMFEEQAKAFSDRYRVVRYDHRGQGGSAKDTRDKLDMDTLADDTAALIEALGLEKCCFVGNSMGGFIGLRLAARRPDLIASAVILGSSADAEVSVEAMDAVTEVIEQNGVSPVVDDVLYFMLGDTTLNDPARAPIMERVTKMLESRTADYANAVWNIAHRKPVNDELAKIKVPVWVVAGSEDHTYPPDHSQRIADGIKNSKYVLMEKTGHVHAVERPDAVNQLLSEHLAATGL